MFIALIVLNLLTAGGCLILAYGCWHYQRRLRHWRRQLDTWERQWTLGLPVTTVRLMQGRYTLVKAQQQYAVWQRRQLQLIQLIGLLEQIRWIRRRF